MSSPSDLSELARLFLKLGTIAFDGPAIALAVAAAFLVFRFELNSGWLVAGGAALGLLVRGL